MKWSASIVYSEKSWGRSPIWNKRQRDLNSPQKIMFSFVWFKIGRLSKIFSSFLCVCMRVSCVGLCVCVSACVSVCLSVSQRTTSGNIFLGSTFILSTLFYERGSLVAWSSPGRQGWLGTKAQGSTVFASQALGLWYIYSTMRDIPHTCYGDQTQVPMLCDKHFTDWSISPALRFIISLLRNGDVFKEI